jgi:hypothetical protein
MAAEQEVDGQGEQLELFPGEQGDARVPTDADELRQRLRDAWRSRRQRPQPDNGE